MTENVENPQALASEDRKESFRSFKSVAKWNLKYLRTNFLGEVSGSLGDLGTLLPILIALAQSGAIDLATTLVVTGIASIVAGSWFGYPLAVQPMKAVAGIVLSRQMGLHENMSAGLTTGGIVAVVSVVGIQMGAGAILIINSANQLSGLGWDVHNDNLIYAILAFCLYYTTADVRKLPHVLIYFLIGITASIISYTQATSVHVPLGVWRPHFSAPSPTEFKSGALNAGIGQVPLTLINSIIAVVFLPSTLYRSEAEKQAIPTINGRTLGLFIAGFNLVGCWFGAMPICFGSGGFAANYRFGARSGASSILFGLFKLFLGLFVSGNGVLVDILQFFPKSILSIMLFFAGFELLGVGWNLNLKDEDAGEKEMKARWDVMAITMGLVIGLKNDFVGLVGGWLAWGLHTKKIRSLQGGIRI